MKMANNDNMTRINKYWQTVVNKKRDITMGKNATTELDRNQTTFTPSLRFLPSTEMYTDQDAMQEKRINKQYPPGTRSGT
jgi:hypothetical protein